MSDAETYTFAELEYAGKQCAASGEMFTDVRIRDIVDADYLSGHEMARLVMEERRAKGLPCLPREAFGSEEIDKLSLARSREDPDHA